MKLIPLLDRTGTTKAWADRQTRWIGDLNGKVFALVSFDGVFDRGGAQVGWWHDTYISDRHGHVVLYRPNARIQNLSMPQRKKIPRPPNLHLPSGHPTLRWLLMPPLKAHGWADFEAFLGALGHTQNGAEKLRAFRERIETQLPRE
jgi:hypothetical protein